MEAQINIPIYRALKLGTKDEYVEGYAMPDKGRVYITTHSKTDFADNAFYTNSYEIDPSTLSLSFPDMLDSEGTRIFASLSKDGKGGDKLEVLDCENANYVAKYIQYQFIVYNINPQNGEWEYDTFDNCDVKVIGIQEYSNEQATNQI